MDSSDQGGRNVVLGKTCHAEPAASCFRQRTKGSILFSKCLFGFDDINDLEHTSFISHGRARQIISFNLKTSLCRTRANKASYFNRITNLSNFICSLKAPGSFFSPQSFKQFVYKVMFTTLVLVIIS